MSDGNTRTGSNGKGDDTARPAKVGRDNWANHATVGDCVLQDGTCFRHDRDRALRRPRTISLRAKDPSIADELDEELSGFAADDVSFGSSTVLAVWRCGQGHTYCASPNARTNARGGSGCGICASKRPSAEHNLAVVAPELVDEWDIDANGGLTPDRVIPQSNRIFQWKCPVADDHRWSASPNNRFGKGSGCPMCSGHRASSTNNLTLSASLMAEWDPLGNEGLDPRQITLGDSTTLVRWTCLKHPDLHAAWPATVDKRMQGRGCPACAGHSVTETNSLFSLRPDLARELDSTRSPWRTADQISIGMNDKVWWTCAVEPEAHRWEASPNSRTSNDTGCPDCNQPGTSKQEIRIAYELSHVLGFDPSVHSIPRHTAVNPRHRRVDMVDPLLHLVIEFDGSYWHSKAGVEERDRAKTESLEAAGWVVVRIREAPLAVLTTTDVVVPHRAPIHDVTTRVLRHLTELGLVDHAVIAEYVHGGTPRAVDASTRAIRDLQKRANPGNGS